VRTSLLLATRNRRQQLRNCLKAIGRLQVPAGSELEILVVDNGSTDGTAEELATQARYQTPGLSLRSLNEPRPGKSRALNTGLRAATGEVLAFIDDDVEVDPDWLVGLEQGFATGAGALQGGIRLRLGAAPPLVDDPTRRGHPGRYGSMDPGHPGHLDDRQQHGYPQGGWRPSMV